MAMTFTTEATAQDAQQEQTEERSLLAVSKSIAAKSFILLFLLFLTVDNNSCSMLQL